MLIIITYSPRLHNKRTWTLSHCELLLQATHRPCVAMLYQVLILIPDDFDLHEDMNKKKIYLASIISQASFLVSSSDLS